MSSVNEGVGGAASAAPPGAPSEDERPVVRDNRVIDPETGEVRARDSERGAARSQERAAAGTQVPDAESAAAQASAAQASGAQASGAAAQAPPASGAGEWASAAQQTADPAAVGQVSGDLAAARQLAEERLADLQRLNAEYVNYRRRVDRDRAVEYARGVSDVVDALIPVLDDLHAARQHGELGGPLAAIADKLEVVLEQRFGVERYGRAGEEFDPSVHEALMHATSNAVEESSVSQVLQPGYRVGERILRAARVAVVSPE